MLDIIFSMLKRLIPKSVFKAIQPAYHWVMAMIAPLFYGNPSNKLIVIGITGTKGKSTTCYLLSRILEEAGHKVGMSSGIIFKIDKREWLNGLKMTMPGRFMQQRLLKQMVEAGCKYAIVETTSEGIKQFRHLGINYDVILFTNLHPEHIESHGSFEKYREAKGRLFYHLTRRPIKPGFGKKISIVNLDDPNADYFSYFPADMKFGYSIYGNKSLDKNSVDQLFKARDLYLDEKGIKFSLEDMSYSSPLFGEMNAYNLLGAITAAKSLQIKDDNIAAATSNTDYIPGRFEIINSPKGFKVIVDYAHDPESLHQLFKAIEKSGLSANGRIIHVFGATGGGRDKAKRGVMGQVSDEYADVIILTNDDPYSESPEQIIKQISSGIGQSKPIYKETDRKQAIKTAVSMAHNGDLVVITGKGSEQAIMLNDGRHDWDDRQVAKDLLSA